MQNHQTTKALARGAQVWRARHLLDVARQFAPAGSTLAEAATEDEGWRRVEAAAAQAAGSGPDLAEVKGQAAARRALEIAAAGSHSLLLVGSPGSGKSMLAQRLAGLLPPMNDEEALESAALASLACTPNTSETTRTTGQFFAPAGMLR